MSAIPRKTQKLFGADLTPTSNVAIWGSLAAGTPAYSNNLTDIQSLAAWGLGLNAAVVGNKSPTMQDLNGLFLLFAQQIAYTLQSGVPEWDATTDYWTNQFARVGKVLYVSQTDNNVGNDPETDTNNWQPYFAIAKGPTLAAAWVEFDGINAIAGNSVIHSSFNVSSVTKNASGSYTINFTDALPGDHYVFSGSCGSEDGQAYGAGDDGLVVGNVSGQGNAIHSSTQCRVFTINPTDKSLVASGNVSVIFFAPGP